VNYAGGQEEGEYRRDIFIEALVILTLLLGTFIRKSSFEIINYLWYRYRRHQKQ